MIVLGGCQPWTGKSPAWPAEPLPQGAPPSPAVAADGPVSRDLKEIEQSGWVRSVRPLHGSPPSYRWRHPAIEEMLARPEAQRPDFDVLVADRATPLPVATAAAIALARLQRTEGAAVLVAAAADRSLKSATRCAAVEALGALPADVAVPKLRELLDEYGHYTPGQPVPYLGDLHAELIRALARHVEPAEDPRFHAGVQSPAGQVRCEVALAWAKATHGDPPSVLLGDTDPEVRVAAVEAVARRRSPQAQQAIEAALNDNQLEVRLAAVSALGILGGPWAEKTLGSIGPESPEWVRAAAARAWGELGQEAPLAAAAQDEAWRVRAGAAEALARFPTPAGAALAKQLLADRSVEVRQQVVRSISGWPLPVCGPILLEGLGNSASQVRLLSAESLAALWPPASEYPVRSDAAHQSAARVQLVARFQAEIGQPAGPGEATPVADAQRPTEAQVAEVAGWLDRLESANPADQAEATARLRAAGPMVADALGQLLAQRHRGVPEVVYQEVLPACDPVFADLRVLERGTLEERRLSIAALAKRIAERPLGVLAIDRLVTLLAKEDDQVVWLGSLGLVAREDCEPAGRLALLGLGHVSPEVRAEACRHLAGHPQPRFASALLPLLGDPSRPVVLAAVSALGRSGATIDTAPLRALLAEPSEPLQLEVAEALLRLGDPAGEAALERLAYGSDPTLLRRVAEIMGEQPRPGFTRALRHLLDGPSGVRLAALASLPHVTGSEPANLAGTTTERRVRAWKDWLDHPTPPAAEK